MVLVGLYCSPVQTLPNCRMRTFFGRGRGVTGRSLIAINAAFPVPHRLRVPHRALIAVISKCRPDEAALEEIYGNRGAAGLPNRGCAGGITLLAAVLTGVSTAAYGAKSIAVDVGTQCER